MTIEFELPDTGEGVTEGQFLEWLIEEGDEVEEDQAVAEVETDKAVVDVPAPADGVIEQLKVEPGDTVDVGEVIMILDDGSSGEESQETEEETEEQVEESDQKEEKSESPDYSSSDEDVLVLPKVRKLAEEKDVDLTSIKTGERITREEVLEAAGKTKKSEKPPQETEGAGGTKHDSEEVLATPAVRKLAREKEVDISEVEGSGRGGKVTRDDILQAAESGVTKTEDKKKETNTKTEGETERVEMSNIRQTIADRMENSKFTAPHVTHVEKANVTDLVALREKEKEKVETNLTYLPFIMKATCLALKRYPDLNAELDEENNEIVQYGSYDFNMAVDTERGLMIPKINNVGEKSIIELAEDIVEKAEKARKGDLSSEEMENGTFTVTNIGVIGGESFTPIINYPQVAILGVGKIQETAEVVEGEVQPRTTVKLSLSYDHRVVDGAEAARFMNKVVENLEDPEKMLMAL